jgi:hypothetical protein
MDLSVDRAVLTPQYEYFCDFGASCGELGAHFRSDLTVSGGRTMWYTCNTLTNANHERT